MILVVRQGALGDFVLTLPVIRALVAEGPVHVVTDRRYACLLPIGATWIDAPWLWAGHAPPFPYTRGIAFSTAAASALRSVGIMDVHAVSSLPPSGVHATAHYASVLARRVDLAPTIVLPPHVARTDAPVVIAPGSGGAAKRWPLARWSEVAQALGSVPRVWVRGPVEAEEGGWPEGAVAPDLPGMIALAASSGAWLGMDAGPSHLAAAVGAQVGVIFGPTDPRCWAPIGATVWTWDTEPGALADWACRARTSRMAAPSTG